MPVDEIYKEISKRLTEKKKLFLVLDRDGTLVPLTYNPDDAVMDASVRASVNRLSARKDVIVAILSARGIKQLVIDFPDGGETLAGNSGLEIVAPSQLPFLHPAAVSARGLLDEAKTLLKNHLSSEFKTILEDHGLSLCLHFHMTPQEKMKRVIHLFQDLKNQMPSLSVRFLPTSCEVWPAFEWDKSFGLKEIVRILQLDLSKVLVVYAGDAIPDEPAFDWVNQENGISIGVGYSGTKSKFHLDAPAQLHELISRLEKSNSCLTD